mmetsp:Transcript_14301/g.24831  ORF Transcript_14301/g.24831 Transcript_14301/m.24831 type:complete len:109 (+) Transcript_14301:64-390(+)
MSWPTMGKHERDGNNHSIKTSPTKNTTIVVQMSLRTKRWKWTLVHIRDVNNPTRNPNGTRIKIPVTSSSTNRRWDILRTPKATTSRVKGRVSIADLVVYDTVLNLSGT